VPEALAAKAVTLAKGSMSVPAGETAVRVRIRRNVRARLRKQSAVSATLTIRAVDGTGNRAVVRKKVRLVR